MGFKYKNYSITLDNYRQIFAKCTPDILDEIRSAVLDDTQISPFIKECGTDSYKLGQLRMAVREFVPPEYLNPRLTARTIYYIRGAYSKKLNISSLLRYITTKGLLVEPTTIEKLAEMVYLGVDISNVDFTRVALNLVDIFCKGLYKGFPMWLLTDTDVTLSESYIKVLMRGMQLDIDVHPFLNGDWEIEQLNLLFVYADKIDLNQFLQVITPKFDIDTLTELIELLRNNVPVTDLVKTDVEGYPIYNPYQIAELGQSIKAGVLTKEMLNPNLQDTAIAELRRKELAKKNRTLSVTF